MKRAKKRYWDVSIHHLRTRVSARTLGSAVRVAYRKLAAQFRSHGAKDKHGRLVQFPPITSNRDGGWDEVSVDLVRKFSAPRYVA